MNKIIIPSVSSQYEKAIYNYIIIRKKSTRKHLHLDKIINTVCAYCTVIINMSNNYSLSSKLKSFDDISNIKNEFERETYIEYNNFYKLGYSIIDFIHIFLNSFLKCLTLIRE